MEKIFLIAAAVLGQSFLGPWAMAADSPSGTEVDSEWPGVHYKIIFVQKMTPEKRIMIGVKLFATSQIPPQGTLLGTPVAIPPHANPFDVAAGYYHPIPFSLGQGSVMVDDLSQANYPSKKQIAPPGRKFRPPVVLEVMRPGKFDYLTLQFDLPPPPPPPPGGGPPPKQTLTFLLAKAKAAVKSLPMPDSDDPVQY